MEFKDLIWNDFDPTQAHKFCWWNRNNWRLAGKSKEARVKFDNGYSCRILIGKYWKSNGIDKYEVQVYRGNSRYTEEPIIPIDGGYLNKDKVSEILEYVENLKPWKNRKKPKIEEKELTTEITIEWIKSEISKYGVGIKYIHAKTGIGKNILRKIITDQDENYLGETEKIRMAELFRKLEKNTTPKKP